MKTQCPICYETTELTFQVDWVNYACPHCQTLFNKDQAGGLQQLKFLPKTNSPLTFHIGQQGVLEDTLWEVGNMAVKVPVDEPFGWREYTLYSSGGDVRFLSEYNGHWILAKEIEGETFSIDNSSGHNYQGEFYPIYADSKYRTEYAAGYFDHPLPEEGLAKDFVRAPHALLLEQSGAEPTFAFEARHVSKQELLAGFPQISLPERTGQGMLQPFYLDMSRFWEIPAAIGGFIVLCHLLLTGFYPSYQVLSEHVLMPDTVPEVTHVSRSFAYTGLRAPLKINLSAPVNNSWAAAEFCLVNEETKAERFGSVEVAYYYGREGGEDWSEGSANPSIKICGVAPGRYHFVMQVAKMPNTPALNALHYTVTAQASTTGNLLLALGLLALTVIVAYISKAQFEKQRWMNSDYPPETEEDY